MLLVEGLASVAAGLVAWRWLDARPRDARWLTREEREALEGAVQLEQRERERAHDGGARPRVSRLLMEPQVALFCAVYFSVQLTIYAATFWLPRLIRDMGEMSDLRVGWLNSIPWALSVVGMMLAAAGAARWQHPRAWLAGALVVAGIGQWASTLGGPVAGFACLCVAALGFKSASSLFWPIPQAQLDARISAAVLALVNSVGNLGGFVAPTVFGWLEKTTGSVHASVLTAVLVFLIRVPKMTQPNDGQRRAS
jgi:cyanate permease